MEVIVTRNMTVAEGGVTRQFTPSDKPVSVSADVAHRLFRSGAAFKASLRDGKVTSDASKDPNAGNVNPNADPNSPTGPLTTTGPDTEPEVDLDGMTKAELLDYAAGLNHPVDVNDSMLKADILKAIKGA